MFREILRVIVLFIFLGLLVSCSKGDPIAIQPQDHSAQAFMVPVQIIPFVGIGERAWDVDHCCPVKVLSEKVGLRLILSPPAVSLGWVSAFWWS